MSVWEKKEEITAYWKKQALSAALATVPPEQLARLQEPFRSLAVWLDACNAEILRADTLLQATRKEDDKEPILDQNDMCRLLKQEAERAAGIATFDDHDEPSNACDEWDDDDAWEYGLGYDESDDELEDDELEDDASETDALLPTDTASSTDLTTFTNSTNATESTHSASHAKKFKFRAACSQGNVYLQKFTQWTCTQKMPPEQWIQHPDLVAFCEVLWGDDAPTVLRILAYRMEGVFQREYCRRAFRCRQSVLPYASILFEILQQMNRLRFHHLTLDAFLRLWRTEPEEYFQLGKYYSSFSLDVKYDHFIPLLVAIRLDDDDPETTQQMRQAIYEEGVTLSHITIRAILFSHREETWKMLADLLLAARLQEGVRQAITEGCSDGNFGAFQYLLRVIRDHDLMRFSSVKRAFATWIGFDFSTDRAAIFKRAFHLMTQYVEAPQTAHATWDALLETPSQETDPIPVFIALCAIGCTEVEVALEWVLRTLATQKVSPPILAILLTFLDTLRYQLSFGQSAFLLQQYADNSLLQAAILERMVCGCTINLERNLVQTFDPNRPKQLPADQIPTESDSSETESTLWNIGYWFITLQSGESTALLTFENVPELFATLRKLVTKLPLKPVKMDHPVFPWISLTLSSAPVWDALIFLAAQTSDPTLYDELALAAESGEMPTDERHILLSKIVEYIAPVGDPSKWQRYGRQSKRLAANDAIIRPHFPKTDVQRRLLFRSLRDRSTTVREAAIHILKRLELTESELIQIENLLSLKSSALRQGAVQIISRSSYCTAAVERLRTSGDAEKIRAADEIESLHAQNVKTSSNMLCTNKSGTNDGGTSGVHSAQVADDAMTELEDAELDAAAEREALDDILRLGLFRPEITDTLTIPVVEASWHPRIILEQNLPRLTELLSKLNQLIDAHRETEFVHHRLYSETNSTETIENCFTGWETPSLTPPNVDQTYYADEAIPEVWDAFFEEHAITTKECFAFVALFGIAKESLSWSLFNSGLYGVKPTLKLQSFQYWKWMGCIFQRQLNRRQNEANEMLEKIFQAISVHAYQHMQTLQKKGRTCREIYACSPSTVFDSYSVGVWMTLCRDLPWTPSLFAARFLIWHEMYRYEEHVQSIISLTDMVQALDAGLIPEETLFRFLFHGNVQAFSDIFTDDLRHPSLQKAVERVAELELQRGELPTSWTAWAGEIKRLDGAIWFVRILHTLGTYKIVRSSMSPYSYHVSRPDVFSCLLRATRPAESDTVETLRSSLQTYPVSEQRLIEGAMCVPEWLDLVGELLQEPNFSMAVWYFRAHMSQEVSEKWEGRLARYSAISPQDFADGAFDIAWCLEAYHAVGKQMFDKLYDAAKYLTNSAGHRRAQIFADAALKRLKPKEVEAKILATRNQEHLMALGILPGNEKDFLHRYELIQQFLKQSRQFGPQRQATEKKVVEIAIGNLARTAGYTDVNRFIWAMEAKQFAKIQPLLEPYAVKDTMLTIVFDSDGKPSLSVEKRGKTLKSIPASLKKDAVVIEMRDAIASLRDQRSRAIRSFEWAMLRETVFGYEEIATLLRNPIFRPLIERLLWRTASSKADDVSRGHTTDFDREKQTTNGKTEHKTELTVKKSTSPKKRGKKASVTATATDHPSETSETVTKTTQISEPVIGFFDQMPEGKLVIVHPLDLLHRGKWAEFQRIFVERQIVQPFKQIFRELYTLNTDEKSDPSHTDRYAGHQIQPRMALALLKSRGWVADYETGLQKVDHQRDIVVSLRANADWFSPSDIEPPTISDVVFFHRKTWQRIPLTELPPIFFSEVMRDLDLMVSVAHAGGVDPEASHSTIEMRAAIIEAFLPYFKLQNVRIEKSHAFIAGSYGKYDVHLGSGVCHQSAVGMLAILPVHTQTRGRVFLPFADDDPKTAEIITKILFLAEDQKIKDPNILNQIRKPSPNETRHGG